MEKQLLERTLIRLEIPAILKPSNYSESMMLPYLVNVARSEIVRLETLKIVQEAKQKLFTYLIYFHVVESF